MADGAAVADVVTPSSWGVKFSDLSPAASGTDAIRPMSGKAAPMLTRFIWDDASEGTTLDVLQAKEPDPESFSAVDPCKLLCESAESICDEIEATLREDREEAVLHGEVCANDPAVATCQRIASHIASWLSLSSGLKWAAFGEDTGGVSLVLRSVITDRRVDFTISADGLRISAVRIDENLTARSVPLEVDDRSSLRENAAWVQSRP